MDTIDIELLKQDLELKIGILRIKTTNCEIPESTMELVEEFSEYKQNGTTLEELKLLYEDVLLALESK